MERLDEAVRRVLTAQEFCEKNKVNKNPATEEDKALLYDVARDCITAVTEEGVSPALIGKNEDRLFIILTPNEFVVDKNNPEITLEQWYFPDKIAKKLEATFPGSGITFLPEFPAAKDNDCVLNMATKYKEVVFVTFCATAAYVGTDGLTRRAEAVINAIARSGKLSTVVHFGNPFALKNLIKVPRTIFGYIIAESQDYAIDVLAGKLEAKGKLPFDIENADCPESIKK